MEISFSEKKKSRKEKYFLNGEQCEYSQEMIFLRIIHKTYNFLGKATDSFRS